MKILITLLKPFSFAPAILMMCVIYSFSAQTGDVSGALSYKISYQIVETKNWMQVRVKCLLRYDD